MVTNGFSWPSIALVSSAGNTSPNAIGTGFAPIGLERVEEDVVLHHAHLEAREVLDLVHRLLGIGEVAEAVLPVGEIDEADGRHLVRDVLAVFAVEDRVGFLLVGEQERQVEHAEVGQDADQRRGRRDHHLLRAGAQRLRRLQVAAQRAAPEALDLHLAAGLLGRARGHLGNAVADRVLLVDAVGQADRALGELRLGGQCECGGRDARGDEARTKLA